jgi:uncharacterized DUF497 family protein
VKIVWDEPKRLANIEGHGYDFADIERFEWSSALIIPSRASSRGGRRLQAIGRLDGRLISIIYGPLGNEAISIISMRRASLRERLRYG